MDQEALEKAKQASFRLLSYRARSTKELSERLKRKGFPGEIINRVISRLKEINYLNDLEFASLFVEDRIKHNPKGRIVIESELRRKGIEKDIIDKVLEAKLPQDKEEELALHLARTKWQRKKDVAENKRRTQIYALLVRRGFPLSLAKEIIDSLADEECNGKKIAFGDDFCDFRRPPGSFSKKT